MAKILRDKETVNALMLAFGKSRVTVLAGYSCNGCDDICHN
jgi:hypothetical protein